MSREPNQPGRDPDGFDEHGSGYAHEAAEYQYDYPPEWDREYAEAPPRRTWRPLITWVVIGALLMGPLLTLLNFYSAEPVVAIAILAMLGIVAYIAHARRGDAMTRIDRAFKKRNR